MRKNWIKKVIAVSILVLFCEAGVVSAYYGNQSINSKPLSRSNILYVGGIGLGNYTKIQDAIDNASDGDTVFVYNNSSPYYEHINIRKEIKLIGEAGYNPIIDGNEFGDIIYIDDNANSTLIEGFTIQNTSTNGIFVGYGLSNVKISKNIIKNCRFGIHCWHSDKIVIEENIIIYNWWGILFEFAAFCTIGKYNHIENNTMRGILLDFSPDNKIISNEISNNIGRGITFARGSRNEIFSNNFINNTKGPITQKNCYNRWHDNYYSNYTGGYPFYIIWATIVFDSLGGFLLPFPQIDLRPAPEPYEIL